MKDLQDRILHTVEPIPESGCWIWLGSMYNTGYGRITVQGHRYLAHRISYTAFNGLIPDDLFVCHRCDIPSCVNPDHLFLGTQKDNMRNAVSKGRLRGQKLTHCKHGHAYTPENTYHRDNERVCRACRNAKIEAYFQRKNVATLERIEVLYAKLQPI